MKLNFKSPPPATTPRLNPETMRSLDALPNGDVYDTRGLRAVLLHSRRFVDHCTVDLAEAGYAVKLAGKLWWGNKATIVELKKKYKI